MAKAIESSVQMLKAAEEAAGVVEVFRPTTSSVRWLIDEAEERAVLHGDSVKQPAQADVLIRKWLHLLLLHHGHHLPIGFSWHEPSPSIDP